MADLKTNLLGFSMNSPIIGASGTVGYGVEYEELADFTKIGGISGKGLTLHGQYGNKGERLWETPSGLINSIGLQNPGVQHFIDVELNEMLKLKQKYGTVAIANLGGHSEEEYVECVVFLCVWCLWLLCGVGLGCVVGCVLLVGFVFVFPTW